MAAAIRHTPSNVTGLDSVSMLSVLNGTALQVREFMLQDSCVAQDGNRNIRSFRENSWFYIENRYKDQSGDINHREPKWLQDKYNVTREPRSVSLGYDELFHLEIDVSQSTNVIRNERNRAKRMQAVMNRLWKPETRSVPSFLNERAYDKTFPQVLDLMVVPTETDNNSSLRQPASKYKRRKRFRAKRSSQVIISENSQTPGKDKWIS